MTSTAHEVEGGFARFPQAWLALPITPQAKTLLMAFCAYADEHGRSWCSFEQLGAILQRSKASIHGYVQELKAAQLINCRHQKYGNGFNYRLLITITDWRRHLEHWKMLAARQTGLSDDASSTADSSQPSNAKAAVEVSPEVALKATNSGLLSCQKIECSVQPVKRMDPSGPKTNIHKTKTLSALWTKSDELGWREFRPRDDDPIAFCRSKPDPVLLRKVIAVAETYRHNLGLLTAEEATPAAKAALRKFMARHRISADEASLSEAASAIAQIAPCVAAIEAAISALKKSWMPHWRRLSSAAQLKSACSEAAEAALPSIEQRRTAVRFTNRAWIARRRLASIHNETWTPPASPEVASIWPA